jgi:hypothetical protein
MPIIERLFVLSIKIVSECASVDDHRNEVALLATESPYTNLSATAVYLAFEALKGRPR